MSSGYNDEVVSATNNKMNFNNFNVHERDKSWMSFSPDECLFCSRETSDELGCGPLFFSENPVFRAHYYCLLFSSGLKQAGNDDEGIYGFLHKDIINEYYRSRRLRCSYCKMVGASVGCCSKYCRTVYHYHCGKKHGAHFVFYENFRSYCVKHRKYQIQPMAEPASHLCPICRETVPTSVGDLSLVTPCCKTTWLHASCIQNQALSAGKYFFRCPICNNTKEFQKEMQKFGIYIPERDASWEMEDNAYSELLERHNRCDIQLCLCPLGRSHDSQTNSSWGLVLCTECGSSGQHVECGQLRSKLSTWHCEGCEKIAGQGYNLRPLRSETNTEIEPIASEMDSISDAEPSLLPSRPPVHGGLHSPEIPRQTLSSCLREMERRSVVDSDLREKFDVNDHNRNHRPRPFRPVSSLRHVPRRRINTDRRVRMDTTAPPDRGSSNRTPPPNGDDGPLRSAGPSRDPSSPVRTELHDVHATFDERIKNFERRFLRNASTMKDIQASVESLKTTVSVRGSSLRDETVEHDTRLPSSSSSTHSNLNLIFPKLAHGVNGRSSGFVSMSPSNCCDKHRVRLGNTSSVSTTMAHACVTRETDNHIMVMSVHLRKSVPPLSDQEHPSPPWDQELPSPLPEQEHPSPLSDQEHPSPPPEQELPSPLPEQELPSPPRDEELPSPPRDEELPSPPRDEELTPAPPDQELPPPPDEAGQAGSILMVTFDDCRIIPTASSGSNPGDGQIGLHSRGKSRPKEKLPENRDPVNPVSRNINTSPPVKILQSDNFHITNIRKSDNLHISGDLNIHEPAVESMSNSKKAREKFTCSVRINQTETGVGRSVPRISSDKKRNVIVHCWENNSMLMKTRKCMFPKQSHRTFYSISKLRNRKIQ